MFFIAFVLILLLFIYKKRCQQMFILKRLGIPGPKPNLIFGNAIEIAKEGSFYVFQKWTKIYGPIVGFYIGGRPQVLITDFDLIRRVMIKDFHLFSNRNLLIPGGIHPQPQLQKTIVWERGNAWRRLRSIMSPSFTTSKLKTMEPLMMFCIENIINKIDDKANCGLEFNLKPIAEELAFSIGTKCILGLDVLLDWTRKTKETENYLKTVRPQLEKSMLAMAMVLFPSLTCVAYPLRVWWETFRMRMMWSPEAVCYDFARKIVQIRKNVKTTSNDLLQSLMDSVQTTSTSDNRLEMTLEDVVNTNGSLLNDDNGGRLSEEEIIANVNVLLLASFEITSVTLQFAISNLVNHPDIQEKLRNELKMAIIRNGGECNFKILNTVPLLNQVIKETLRIYTPGTLGTSRIAEENYEFQGYQIPKGTGVFIGITSIHNDPQLWHDPDKFDPERFEQEFDKLSFLSFGIGPRNCIGMQFAYMELQLVLANLVLKYRFEPGPSTEKNIEIAETSATYTPKNGVFCKVLRAE